MTGVVFASLGKFIEIGNIINKNQESDVINPEKQASAKKQNVSSQNKRTQKQLDKQSSKTAKNIANRKIRHFSSVQHKQLYWQDLENYRNRIMMSKDNLMFWHLEPQNEISEQETSLEQRKNQNVIYLKLKLLKHEFEKQGVQPHSENINSIANLFTKFGDLNVSFILSNLPNTIFHYR
jgi:hypothetical protein